MLQMYSTDGSILASQTFMSLLLPDVAKPREDLSKKENPIFYLHNQRIFIKIHVMLIACCRECDHATRYCLNKLENDGGWLPPGRMESC